jgi:hypothetical protein
MEDDDTEGDVRAQKVAARAVKKSSRAAPITKMRDTKKATPSKSKKGGKK